MNPHIPTSSSASLIESEVVRMTEVTPGYLKVVIDNGSLNLFDPMVFAGLNEVKGYIEGRCNAAKVIVFESASPDFFIAHLDFARLMETPTVAGGANIIKTWPIFTQWLSNAPVVSIAKVRGRARGIGNEFICACDMRFASREKARLCQIEAGFALVPGGGGLEWLPRHVGRARALEIVMSADDFDADTAQLYGWVNRSLADADLDDYVDRLARRIATFDSVAIATTKQLIGKRQPTPTQEDFAESFGSILRLASSDVAKQTSSRLKATTGGSLAPVEMDLPKLYG